MEKKINAWAVCDESRKHGSEGGKTRNRQPIPIGSATLFI